MLRIVAFVSVLLMGCAAVQPTDSSIQPPELISMTRLPQNDQASPAGALRLTVALHILENGTVSDAKVIESSGFENWDSAVVKSARQWRYTAARRNGRPIDLWLRQPVVVRPQEPVIRILGELVSSTRQEADSLYNLLLVGADFDVLAGRSGEGLVGEQSRFLGAVDIAIYPQNIRGTLQSLRENDVTRPLRVGEKYIIYKRFKKSDLKRLPG